MADRKLLTPSEQMQYELEPITRAPVDIGDKVMIHDIGNEGLEGTVSVLLSAQFIARVPHWGEVFRLYKYKGITWDICNEKSK